MSGEPKQYVVERVRRALAEDERVHELSLEVKVAGERIFISGSVPTPERKAAIDDVVAEQAPGFELANETVVARTTQPEEAEELA